MASNVTLSAGVRQNLLSLQSTAAMMSQTQGRLSTGKKVNSALDNPVNFFTSSSLQARAGDLGALIDSMANGIKQLQAADNGITSITSTVQSMQSTIRQARQDKSFKSTSFTMNLPTTLTGNEQLSLSGGAVGTAGVDIDLTTAGTGTAATFTAGTFSAVDLSAAGTAPTAGTATLDSAAFVTSTFGAGDTITFNINVDGAGATPVTITGANVAAVGDADATIDDVTELAAILTAKAIPGVSFANVGGDLVATSASTGTTSTVAITGATANDTSGDGTVTAAGLGAVTSSAGTAATGDSISFTLNIDGNAAAISLDSTITAVDTANVTAAELATAINAQANTALGTTGITYAAVDTGGDLTFSSGTTGTTSSVSITGYADTGAATSSGIADHAVVNGTGTAGGGTTAKTVDELVAEINSTAALADKVVASSDNGKLRIQNLSTADLTVTGVNATSGAIDGGTGTGTIGGNDVRKTLVTQFNTLLDQLNKTADDSSFNGINLLRADKLKLVFNEIGTSTLEIQAKDTAGQATAIDAAYLGITTATNADFGSDSTLDSLNDTMTTALSTLRAQASSFGSNMSIVQNRQDFTKSMINTLQTGADNLVLADTNEEGANLLALQTRQQLSTTALSLSSQADQAVLRLF